MRRSSLGLAAALAVLAVTLLGGHSSPASADAELKVAVLGDVHSDAYPTIETTLSVVEGATGRPVAELSNDSVTITDDAGKQRVVSVDAVTSAEQPVSYVLLIDTSSVIGPYLQRVVDIADEFTARIGPNDVVRVVKFNSGADERGTNWVTKDDPNLLAQFQSLQPTDIPPLVGPSLIRAAAIAQSPPDGFQRRAVIAFVGLDGARTESGLQIDTIKSSLNATFFTFGFGETPDQGLSFFLEDLGKYSGGAYWPVNAASYPADPTQLILDAMQRSWKVKFTADGLPDSKAHKFSAAVRDPLQRSGATDGQYQSGSLTKVSPITFKGITEKQSITQDRDIEVSYGGQHPWKSTKLELFQDCDPGHCSPVASAEDQAISWKIQVAPLGQGQHRLVARITASDGTREFSDTKTVRFQRSGTTFNLGAFALVAGIAAVAIVATSVLIRQKGQTRWR